MDSKHDTHLASTVSSEAGRQQNYVLPLHQIRTAVYQVINSFILTQERMVNYNCELLLHFVEGACSCASQINPSISLVKLPFRNQIRCDLLDTVSV